MFDYALGLYQLYFKENRGFFLRPVVGVYFIQEFDYPVTALLF